MGHKLISDGGWYKCTECRKKCMKTNYENRVNNRCVQAKAEDGSNHGRLTHGLGEVGIDSNVVCSLRKRKRLIGKQKEALKERREQDILYTKEAWAKANHAISWTLWGRMSSGINHPPIRAHWTHALISCGGFGGCIRCGSVVGDCKSLRLVATCRRCLSNALEGVNSPSCERASPTSTKATRRSVVRRWRLLFRTTGFLSSF